MTIKINGVEITQEAVEYELRRLVKFYADHMPAPEVQKQMGLLRKKAAEQAIGARLLIDESSRLAIEVPVKDLDARMAQWMEQSGGREKFLQLLKKQGLTESQVRKSVEQGRKVDRLVEKVTAGAAEPTELEMRSHYESHREEYMRPEQAQVQHILLKPASGGREDRSIARSRLLAIRQAIEDGADFAVQAASHSECPSGKKAGGRLGWIGRGTMVPAFDQAVFALEVGQLSDVVETPLGLHVIQKTAQEEARPAPFEEVQDRIRDFLRHAKRGELLAAYVKDLRAKAVIEED